MNRHLHRFGLVTAAACLVLTGCDTTADEPDETPPPVVVEGVELPSPMRVGITLEQPLFGVQTASGVIGFDADIAREVVARLGGDPDDIEFVDTVFDNREPFLVQDQVDMVVATYTITDERDEQVDFAGPYFIAGQDILVLKDNPDGITGVEDLDSPDVTTCTADGTTSLARLEELAPSADIITFDAIARCVDALAAGRVHAVSTDNTILLGLAAYPRGEIQREGLGADSDEFELVDNPFSDEPYGIGLPEGSDLRCPVNEALQSLIDDGTWQQFYDGTVAEVQQIAPDLPAIDTTGC